ncbi:FecR family protein [Chryseobacterium arachidis]|uniref:FecR family protein n=1 Tax=Chryseobacterium arachidis TaxID=1416778 RepID=A0A1M5IC93_9FLAO|nr:FecR family protein [Chryseobacterium arachidis]SHG25984.1 FecR family protein [Chryseobacterium arachidis]
MKPQDDDIEPLTDQEAKQVWEQLTSRIKAHEEKKKKNKIIKLTSIMVAATVLLIFSIVAYRNIFVPQVYQADRHDLYITLKDGSKVTLLKGSSLTIEKSFPAETRDVYLQGNAIFNVAKSKDHPFIVHAGNYQAKVLGTVFKVLQKGSNFNIDLYEGKVQVSQREKPQESYIITPNETFSNLGDKNVAVIAPTAQNAKDPENKTFSASLAFKDFNLKKAIAIAEQTYHIKIIYPSDRDSSKISVLSHKETAEEFIERISIPLNLNIKKINENTFQLQE